MCTRDHAHILCRVSCTILGNWENPPNRQQISCSFRWFFLVMFVLWQRGVSILNICISSCTVWLKSVFSNLLFLFDLFFRTLAVNSISFFFFKKKKKNLNRGYDHYKNNSTLKTQTNNSKKRRRKKKTLIIMSITSTVMIKMIWSTEEGRTYNNSVTLHEKTRYSYFFFFL